MNPSSLTEARTLFDQVKRRVARARKTRIVVCPPDLYLGAIAASYRGTSIAFGSQDVSAHEKIGKHTGSVSGSILRNSGVSYCLVGHSERRADGETDSYIARKTRASLRSGLVTILCVGEAHRDTSGRYLRFVEKQIKESLKGVTRPLVTRLVLAYEPIWAIGKSAKNAMKPTDVHQMNLFVRKALVKQYGRKAGMKIPILYGGSVEPGNVGALIKEAAMDGFLVGHASRTPADFAEIVKAMEAC
jgi:triosephosphate isomerase